MPIRDVSNRGGNIKGAVPSRKLGRMGGCIDLRGTTIGSCSPVIDATRGSITSCTTRQGEVDHLCSDCMAQPSAGGNRSERGVPVVRWQQIGKQGCVPRGPLCRTVASFLLLLTAERTMRLAGITFEHLQYPLIALPSPYHAYGLPQSATTFQMSNYLGELSRLWIFDPSSPGSDELVAEDLAYTAHLSLWQHRVIKQYARSLGTPAANPLVLKQAKTLLQPITAAVLQRGYDARSPPPVRRWFDWQVARCMCEPPA